MKVQKYSKISGSSIFIMICLFYIKFSSAALSFGKSACDSPQSWRLQRHCLEMPYTKNGPQWKTDLVYVRKGYVCCYKSQECHVSFQFNSIQSLSLVRLFATQWTTGSQAALSITSSQSLPKLMSIKSVMQSNHLILCHSLLLLPLIFPSIRVFSNKSALHIRWTKYWSFSFNISSSNEHPGLISFRTAWLDLLAVQGTLKSLLQYHSSKLSINSSALSFLYSPTLTSIHDYLEKP